MEHTERQSFPRRRAALIAGVGLVVTVLAYCAFWYQVSSRAETALKEWALQQRQAGYAVQWDRLEVSGFPFRVDMGVMAPVIADDRTKWRWAVDVLTLGGRPWNWSAFDLEAAGQHRFVMSHPDGRIRRDYRFDFGQLDIKAEFTGDQWREIGIRARTVSIQRNGHGVVNLDALDGAASRVFIADADDRTRTGRLELVLKGAETSSLPESLIQTAGNVVQAMGVTAELYGPIPPEISPVYVAAWRDAGGVVEVRDLHASYGPLGLDGEGTLALDSMLQPLGSFSVEITGVAEIVDLMVAARMVTEGNALATKLVLGALSKRDPATGISRVTLPVTLQGGMLQMGPVPLLKIPLVSW